MSISIRIQELREQNGLSQEQLADKLNVSRQAISKWETEQANPDISNIILLSEIFDVSTDYILTGKQENIVQKESPSKWSYHDILKMFLTILGVILVGVGGVFLAKLLISLGN